MGSTVCLLHQTPFCGIFCCVYVLLQNKVVLSHANRILLIVKGTFSDDGLTENVDGAKKSFYAIYNKKYKKQKNWTKLYRGTHCISS